MLFLEILDLPKSHSNIPNAVKVLGIASIFFLILTGTKADIFNLTISVPKLLLPLVLLIFPTIFYTSKDYSTKDAFYLLGNIYLISTILNLLVLIRNYDIYLLIYLLSIPIFNDIFAYSVGSLIGKHKLALEISPKKSWEGAIAGLIGGSLIALIIFNNLVFSINYLPVIPLTLLLSIIGQMGDLIFSRIKRENEIKDFSDLMPGHGGIMDRIDSIAFVVIVFILIIQYL